MSQEDLIKQCFYYINSFKRHRALEQIKSNEGKHQEAQFHQLKQYQFIDSLELGMRAIQKGSRTIEGEDVRL